MNYSNYKSDSDQHGGMIPTMPGEMYGNSHEVYDVYPRGYDDRDISYGSYIAGDHFDEPPPPTYSTSYHQLHPGAAVVVSTGDPGLSQDDPYGVGAAHPPQQQSPSPPLSDRAYVSNPYGDPRLRHPGSLAFPDVDQDNEEEEADPPLNGDLPPVGGGGGDLRWRDPDLEEVIEYLSHENEAIRANAAGKRHHHGSSSPRGR
jgi:hypothetical protein